MSNIVAIVGRPNVGKSTLFNRLTGERKAVVHESSGVTRDRHYGKSFWNGVDFSLIDTGGYVHGSDDIFESEIRKQVLLAINEADVILFVTDTTVGLTDFDDLIASMLRKTEKPVLLVANKADNNSLRMSVHEFYKTGLDKIFPVSAVNGSGTGDLLDELVKVFPDTTEDDEDELPKFAVVGRPNVGKSSLLNAITGEERNIVTPVSGTTRDSINTRYSKFGYDFILTDTAGLRKKAKVHENVEFYSVMRSVKAVESSDVCILMIDARDGITGQDLNIFRLIRNNNKGVVIAVNKWDLIEKETHTAKKFEKEIRNKIAPFDDVPLIFTSVLNMQRIHKTLQTANEVYQNRQQKISTAELNKLLLPEIERYPPPSVKGKYIRIKYITRLPTHAPSFAFFCNLPQYIKEPYKRYLENSLRKHFNFSGVPLRLFFKKKSK